MIRPNTSQKALVPYSYEYAFRMFRLENIKHNLISDVKCTSNKRVYLFCKSRYKTYLFFLSLFFLLSTFSCCLYFEKSDYGAMWSLNVLENFKQHGFTFLFIVTNFSWVLAYRLLSFVLGYSFLSSASAVVCSCRVFFMSAYFFVSTIGRFIHKPFYFLFVYVLVFAAIVFADVIYFTETRRLLDAYNTDKSRRVFIRHLLFFAVYISAALALLYLQLLLSISVF